jgi:dUTPase
MLKAGERVAQGLILPVRRAEFMEIEEMDAPDRGGHGSTGS